MTTGLGIVNIPASYEVLRDVVGVERIGQVLIECEDDLSEFKKYIAEITTARQGKLLFLKGESGQGKTSFIESTSVFLSDAIGYVVTAPPDYKLPLTGLIEWLNNELPRIRRTSHNRHIVVNLDGREIPVLDEAATQAAMGNLNTFLRNTPDLFMVWPVNQRDFAEQAIERLKIAGGESALVSIPIHVLKGLKKDRYFDVLRLVLDATSMRLEDAAISENEARSLVDSSQRIGEYLRNVQQLVVSRYDLGEIGAALPRLMVAITSNDDTYTACRMLRRGTRFMVDADNLLRYSRANVADDWRTRGRRNPRTGLPFIAALFEVQLLNISSSAVVNACAFGDDEELKRLVRTHYPKPVSSNAANSMRNSAIARALMGQDDVGVAAANPSAAIQNAYNALQKLTNRKHCQINKSIVHILKDQLNISMPDLDYEHKPFPGSAMELRADVWCVPGDRPLALEFTHRRNNDATVAVIASYMLKKIQDYARDYNLI
ncbi:MAG: hypothetical protein JW876_02555 [Candidatus Krumholzibacteriota bacterium]|nr:hypothetical protein [Candidatus Krumholzibacteriota bacterium]